MTCLPIGEHLTYPDAGYLSDDSSHLIILALGSTNMRSASAN